MNKYSEGGSNRSKYQNSSKKIKQLYSEFQNLKQRISTPIKHRKQPMLSFYDNKHKNFSTQLRPASTSFTFDRKKQDFDLGAKSAIDHEARTYLKNTIQKFVVQNISGLQKKIDLNVSTMQDRVLNLSKVLTQVNRFVNLKMSNITALKNIKCNCKWNGEEIKQVQQKYNAKIEEIKCSYENKISLLLKDVQTSGSSDTKRIPRETQEQLRIMEEKMLIKQEQITQLKLQLTRLRRSCDHKEKLYEEKETLIQELSKQNQEKINQVTNVKKSAHMMRKQVEQRMKIQLDKRDDYQQKIRLEIQSLLKKNQKLEQQVATLKADLEERKQSQFIRSSIKSKANQWNFSQIQQQSAVNSDFEEEEVINNLKIDPVDNLQPLRHSHIIHTNTNKKSFQLGARLKELQSQLQLVTQQNRLLKGKKDKFQEQVKQNQSDEQKFQMQGQILREQLKRMNVSIKNLDDCALILFKGIKVPADKVQILDEGLKFKEAYFKKYPNRSNSQKKK